MPYPERFVPELRNALAHLHDPAYLENHPLARRIGLVAQAPDLTRGEVLRRTLRLSIEALDPEADLPPNAPEARPFQVLRGRYILRQSLDQVAAQLDIGRRQAYRELRRAVAALAQMLWDGGLVDTHVAPGEGEPLPPAVARLRAEVERLSAVREQDVDVGELLARTVESARRLANDRGLAIQLHLEAESLRAAVNRVMLRQAVLNLLSHALHVQTGEQLQVRLSRCGGQAVIRLVYGSGESTVEAARPGEPYAVALELLETMGLEWKRARQADGSTQITLTIPLVRERTVLVVDDNEGVIRLFQRYLEGQPYRVSGASNAERAQELLAQLEPDVVILDVMMPERDGWEVLETLRQSEAGRRARVLVCSIINDPPLAAALGADGFLHKPVDRLSLLQALSRLLAPETTAGGAGA